jgi:hypothetical protein
VISRHGYSLVMQLVSVSVQTVVQQGVKPTQAPKGLRLQTMPDTPLSRAKFCILGIWRTVGELPIPRLCRTGAAMTRGIRSKIRSPPLIYKDISQPDLAGLTFLDASLMPKPDGQIRLTLIKMGRRRLIFAIPLEASSSRSWFT